MGTKKQAILDTIKIWELRTKWAKIQQPKKKVNYRDMENGTGYDLGCSTCPFCKKYAGDGCPLCPLKMKYGNCAEDNSLFQKVMESKTWGIWVKRAEKFLVQLKCLLPRRLNKRR